MINPQHLSRLARDTVPTKEQSDRMKKRILMRLEPSFLRQVAGSVHPSHTLQRKVKTRVMHRIGLPHIVTGMKDIAHGITPSSAQRLRIREHIAARIQPLTRPLVHASLKWSAAFAVLLFVVRFVVPLAVLAPHTEAQTAVQIVPKGTVTLLIGGVQLNITEPYIVHSAITIETTKDSEATVFLHDDAVLRLSHATAVKLYDLTDRPQVSSGPTAALLHGTTWVLSLVPLSYAGISIETPQGTAIVNEASVALETSKSTTSLSVYDRAAIFEQGKQQTLLGVGDQAVASLPSSVQKLHLSDRVFTTPWVSENLQEDSAHRSDILAKQEKRIAQQAGILPTSVFYPLKRVAEQVNVLFAFNSDERAQVKLDQAQTRLDEAAVLLKDGDTQSAAVPLSEYRQTLLDLASGSSGNLVQFLINKQLADANASMTTATPDNKLYALKQAVYAVTKDLPNTNLKPKDVEGYVLNDKLADINQSLMDKKNVSSAMSEYAEVQPYLQSLLKDKSGTHPLLQVEAQSLLAKISSMLDESVASQQPTSIAAIEKVQDDIKQYLPQEPAKKQEALVTAQQLDDRVAAIKSRIFTTFELRQSRINQVIVELNALKGDPNEGALLRRLDHALPPLFAQDYVEPRLQQLIDELKDKK